MPFLKNVYKFFWLPFFVLIKYLLPNACVLKLCILVGNSFGFVGKVGKWVLNNCPEKYYYVISTIKLQWIMGACTVWLNCCSAFENNVLQD